MNLRYFVNLSCFVSLNRSVNLSGFVGRGFNRDTLATNSDRALAPEAPLEILTHTHP